jgi:hypothetical protein
VFFNWQNMWDGPGLFKIVKEAAQHKRLNLRKNLRIPQGFIDFSLPHARLS